MWGVLGEGVWDVGGARGGVWGHSVRTGVHFFTCTCSHKYVYACGHAIGQHKHDVLHVPIIESIFQYLHRQPQPPNCYKEMQQQGKGRSSKHQTPARSIAFTMGRTQITQIPQIE